MDWQRLLSRLRLGVAGRRPDSEARTDFQRDFDRLVFSAAFRRLQDKTQVFPLAQGDYVRTRLTHSLEVSSVGRSLGHLVGDVIIRRHRLNDIYPQDVGAIVAAASLAHDIGNPPFGHAGEDAIRCWFAHTPSGQAIIERLTPPQRRDLLRFEGNAQGFRLLTRLQSPDNRGGLQLTYATLGTFSKYPCASPFAAELPGVAFTKFGFFSDDAEAFAQLAQGLGLIPAAAAAWQRHPLAFLVEGADDICYRIIDIEDAFRFGLLGYEEVEALLLPLATATESSTAEQTLQRLAAIGKNREKIEFLRAKAIGCCVREMANLFLDSEAAILAGRLTQPLVELMVSGEALAALKQRAMEKIYVAPSPVEIGAAGFEVLGGLLQAFGTAVEDIAERGDGASPKSRTLMRLLPSEFRPLPEDECYRRILGVTDFISGMTDSYAVTLYKKITGISLPRG